MEIVNNFIDTGKKFAYVRRTADQIRRRDMKVLFKDINDLASQPEILGDTIKYDTENGFHFFNDDGQMTIIGYPFSIEEGVKRKGIPWNDINLIFFDEFLEYGRKIVDEVPLFLNLISTIVRTREDVVIYMCANTVSKASVYFDLFGIDYKQLKRGHIYTFKHIGGVTGAIERCFAPATGSKNKVTNKYIGFDNNPTSDMILYGEWEYDKVNTLKIDGIGWECQRKLIPLYLTALGNVYEMSIYENQNPILFVRKINTQEGMVRKDIKYNLSFDNSIQLVNSNGIVPQYGAITDLIDEDTRSWWWIAMLCIESKRVVYSKLEDGSDFMRTLKELKKGG